MWLKIYNGRKNGLCGVKIVIWLIEDIWLYKFNLITKFMMWFQCFSELISYKYIAKYFHAIKSHPDYNPGLNDLKYKAMQF